LKYWEDYIIIRSVVNILIKGLIMRLVASFRYSKLDGVYYNSYYQLKIVKDDGSIEPYVDDEFYRIFEAVAKNTNSNNILQCSLDKSTNTNLIHVKINLISLLENEPYVNQDYSNILDSLQKIIIEHFIKNKLLEKTFKYRDILRGVDIDQLKFDIS